MHGFGRHTFSLINAKNERCWVKFHLVCQQGIKNLTDAEAEAIIAKDRESHQRDLYNSIEQGEFPRWKMCIQVMPEKDAAKCPYHPFDLTKVWLKKDYSPIEVGMMELNRNPENYFAEVEQAAFSPGNFVPGIGPSPDKMLQGRLFSYHDTHRHRLGPNYHLLPVNAPKATKLRNYQRDGFMRSDGNGGGGPNYWPNSFGGPAPDPAVAPPPIDVAGMAARHSYELGDVDFVQAGDLYRKVMTDEDRDHLVRNIVSHLKNAQRRLQLRQTALFHKADAEYGERVAKGLGLSLDEVKRLASMSQEERVRATAR